MRILKALFLAIILTSVWCSVLTGQSYVVHKSHTGFDQLLYKQILIDKATEVQDSLQSYGVNDFKIVGDDYYHLYNFIGEGSTFETYHGFSLNDIESHYPNGFLFIAKEHSEEGKLRYRVELKTPSDSLFSELDPFEVGAVASNILAEINRVAALNNFSKGGNAGAEAAGLALFLNYLRALDSGDFSLQNPLDAAGFEGTAVISEDVVSIDASQVNTSGVQYGYGYVAYDYAGVKVSNNGGTPTLLRDLLTNDAAQDIASIANQLTNALIITGVGNSKDDIREAEARFESTNESFVLWVHYQSYANTGDSLHIKTKSNLSLAREEAVVDWYFYQIMSIYRPDLYPPIVAAKEDDEVAVSDKASVSCGEIVWDYGKTCILPIVQDWETGPNLELRNHLFDGGIAAGILDGLFGTIQFLWETGSSWSNRIFGTIRSVASYGADLWNHYRQKGIFTSVLKKVRDDATNLIENEWAEIVDVYETMKSLASLAYNADWSKILEDVYTGIKGWLVEVASDSALSGYFVGQIAFEVVIGAFSGGSSAAARFLPKVMSWAGNLGKRGAQYLGKASKGLTKMMKDAEGAISTGTDLAKQLYRCKILGQGCFIAGTLVFTATGNQSIDSLKLFDYVAANTEVYEISNSEEQIDIHVSRNQLERDVYAIDSSNWFAVGFMEINGTSTLKVAFHRDWMKKKGYDSVGATHFLNLPEQGVSNFFKLTSVEHILPKEKPLMLVGNTLAYKPVTGIFTHETLGFWKIILESNDTLGVTGIHPIFSLTANEWVSAEELKIGEILLTKKGGLAVSNKIYCDTSEKVWNLEVKDLHNFLVGESGTVVHNSYIHKIARPADVLKVRNYVERESRESNSGVDELLGRLVIDGLDEAHKKGKKLTWPELLALFKRGNKFNKKAIDKDWYDYHEIHLSNGKRLDSYDPVLGKIVSRKATTFDDIKEVTFERYLKELKNKYAPGTKIRSNKYPDIDGEVLQGQKILEVPDFNQNSPLRARFEQLAAKYNTIISYRPE